MREPPEEDRRLLEVRHLLAVAVVAAASMAISASALAQTSTTISAALAFDGWVDPGTPVDLELTVSSDVLVDGEIQASLGGVVVSVPAQVPAASTKRFSLTLPPPTTAGSIQIKLLDRSGNSVAVARVDPRHPTEEVMLGLVSGADPADFARIRTPVVDRPIEAIELGEAGIPGFIDYVVSEGFASLEQSFVDSGGTVITESVPPGARILETGDGFDRYRVGTGEVIAVSDVSDVSTYSSRLLAGPLRTGPRDFWQSPDQTLTDAAANSGEGGIPELPWLWGTMVGYAILVGPVNLAVLHRLGRRELAWITIPALSLAALATLWLVGGQRLETATVNHATLLLGGDADLQRTSVVFSTGRAGEISIDFASADAAYPWTVGNRFNELGQPVGSTPAEVSGSTVTFQLQRLGFAAAGSIGRPTVRLPHVSASETADGRITLSIDNDTDLSFWAWGVGVDGSIVASDGAMDAGESADLATRGLAEQFFRGPDWGWSLGNSIVERRQLWNDDRGWRILSPLGQAAQSEIGEAPERFFFGFTEDFEPDVEVNGDRLGSSGMTLVLVPLEPTADAGGRVAPEVISVGSGDFSQEGPGFTFVFSDEVWLRFDLPSGELSPKLLFRNEFGPPPGDVSAWNWDSGLLEAVSIGAVLEPHFLSPAGDVVLRVGTGNRGEFGDIGFYPETYTLSWDQS